MKSFWMDHLTLRGWIALWSLIVIGVLVFSYATRDVCYVGGTNNLGYGSCNAMIDSVTK